MTKVSNNSNTIQPTTNKASTAANSLKGNGLNDIDLNEFLNLMLTELQNQDPLNPTDNAALLQQVGELRSISSNDQLVYSPESILDDSWIETTAPPRGQFRAHNRPKLLLNCDCAVWQARDQTQDRGPGHS